MKIITYTFFLFVFSFNFYAQNGVIINGLVLDKVDNSPVSTAIISVDESSEMVVVNNKGAFVLELKQALPINLTIKAIGFKDFKYLISSSSEDVKILLEEDITSLDEIVIAASRTPERVLESPVSIERMGVVAIERTTSPSFYDGLENLKGVDVNTSSLTFKTVNTRGFSAFGNTRFVQLVDGMDNSSPGLSFALGNLIGLNELDVQSVELLPGASSALYGANAFNGIMFMRSKSPFIHEGTSVYGKTGVTNSGASGVNDFIDVGIRVAKKINNEVALKFTASLLKATDWFSNDTRNIDIDGKILDGDRNNTLDYNGINIYGDEFTNPDDLGFGKVSRTGYREQDLVNPDTDSFRAAIAAHFRPFEDDKDIEIIYSSKFGTGNTIYQAASKYALRNFIMHQHKLELQSKHLMLRSYITVENAGDSYDIRFAGINTLRSGNNASKASGTGLSVDQLWFGTYGRAFGGLLAGVPAGNREIARKTADAAFRTNPNSVEFKQIFNRVINDSDVSTGAKFVDASRLYHSDINYNFKELIEFAEVQVGGSARRYVLNSSGTLFTDTENENITYDEFGIYTQLQKKMIDDRLKLTGSLRYDKAQNFDGNFSPRASVSFSVDQKKDHNIRASFQTGFRNPTTQEQYIGLDIGRTILIGSANDNPTRYNREFEVNSTVGKAIAGGNTLNFNGEQGYKNSYTRASVGAFANAIGNVAGRVTQIVTESGGTVSVPLATLQATQEAASLLQKSNVDFVKPEQVVSYEIGYRGRLAKHTVLDFSAYYNKYKDFISIVTTIAPLYGDIASFNPTELASSAPINNSKALLNAIANNEFTPTSLYTNTNADVASYGMNLGLETRVFGDYNFGINYTYAKQDFDQSEDPDFETQFNTPEHKVKLSLENSDVYKGLGFGINTRWQDAFYWESTFVDGMISARTLLDVQLMYAIKKWNSKIKAGGANILANEYESAPGSGTIGSQLYGSWTYTF